MTNKVIIRLAITRRLYEGINTTSRKFTIKVKCTIVNERITAALASLRTALATTCIIYCHDLLLKTCFSGYYKHFSHIEISN